MSSETTEQMTASQRMLLALKEARAKLEAFDRAKTEPIAIIGIGCRFPGGANNPETFWQLLRDGVDAITEVPRSRWNIDEYYDPNPETPGKVYTRYGGFLENVDQFDPQFFGISPREAVSMNPQQRLLLEVAWEALEEAGINPKQLVNSLTGVFLGVGPNDYAKLRMNADKAENITAHDGTGNGLCFASGRLSYILGLQGPNLAMDTSCSSSLVAVHLASQSLRAGECNLAIAGGVNLNLFPETTLFLSRTHALAPDGRCKTFDAAADGFGRSEGCGVIILKRLSDALADGDGVPPTVGDRIWATIRGSAVNHDGPSSGLTVPNQLAQEQLIQQALDNAKVTPAQVTYIEAHGTGTSLGDPIEVGALASVFCRQRSPEEPLVIGSVKTNLGHLEAAAGIAGLIKTVLALHHGEIPPHLHFHQPSPHIPWENLPVIVPTQPTPWQPKDKSRIAGVSSFGMSGTNVHIVLESPVETLHTTSVNSQQKNECPVHLLALSAKTGEALKELAINYTKYLQTHPQISLADLCFTANTGRSHFEHRLAVVTDSVAKLQTQLSAFAENQATEGLLHHHLTQRKTSKIAFLFTGQGSQYLGMGKQLYDTQPVFRETLDHCDEILRPYLEKPLLEILYPQSPVPQSPVNETAYTQPALFALEYSLYKLWQSWGINPTAVIGHSLGEYVAACVAGVFSLEDGLKLIAQRAKLMQSLPPGGSMVAVLADESTVRLAIQNHAQDVTIAAINAPENIVIAGKQESVQAVVAILEQEGIKTRNLTVSHAFHSPLVEPILEEFAATLQQITFHAPQIPLISNVTGKFFSPGEIPDVAYWQSHTRAPVRFMDGVKTLFELGCKIFLELGPKPVLANLGKQCQTENSAVWLASLMPEKNDFQVLPKSNHTGDTTPKKNEKNTSSPPNLSPITCHLSPVFLHSLSTLYIQGVAINWQGLQPDYPHQRLSLPTYPFQRQRYWIEHNNIPMNPTHENSSSVNTQRQGEILAQLRSLVGQVLQVPPDKVDVNTPFLEMGADSIFLMEGVRSIENSFGVKIAIRQFFEELATINALATYIEQHIAVSVVSEGHRQELAISKLVNDYSSESTTGQNFPSNLEEVSTQTVATIVRVAPSNSANNGNGASSSHSDTAIERIMAQQLQMMTQIMSEQLQVLRGTPASTQPNFTPTNGNGNSNGKSKTTNGNGNGNGNSKGHHSPLPTPHSALSTQHSALLNPHSQKHLEDLIQRYTQRTQKSKQRAQASRHHLGDNRAVAGFRMGIKEMLYPIVGTRYQGAHFWDLDGNEYVDLAMGFGTHLFGHGAPFLIAAINEQLQKGVAVGPQPELALETAELLCELTGAERATFCQSGSESVMVALRLARTATKRDHIAIFTGSYHGHFDGVLAQPEGMSSVPLGNGIAANTVKDVLVLNYGDPKALEILQAQMHTLAAVMVEPVQSRFPNLQPREFLQELRHLTEAAGTALIFDEIMTGFRIHPGGAQAHFGVKADLATYSKIFGGGLPLAAVAGKAKFMDGIDGGYWQFGDQSYPQADRTFFAGTFNKHPLAMATCRAALKYLKEQGVQLQTNLNARTAYLVEQLNHIFTEQQIDIRVVNFGSLFRFVFTANMDVFFYHLLEKGVYIWEGRTCFLSTAHTDADIEWIIQAVRDSITEMRSGGFFPHTQQENVTGKKSPASLPTANLNQPVNKAGFWERRKQKTTPREKTNYIPSQKVQFSLYYFGNYESEFSHDKYDLLFTGAKFGDKNGFSAVWIPERHFHAFGGFSPNPSVIAAALARETQNIQIRSGSVVLPIHHPIRVVEEWSVVDNLSQGRVGISFASGWNPNDFVLAPQSFGKHRELMFQQMETVRKLWRGESIQVQNGVGQTVSVEVFPKPMQAELQDWITIVNNPDTYIKAGEMGAGVLTNLMGQSVEDLAENIALYRESLAEHGYDSSVGRVTVLLHTFVGNNLEQTRQQAREPLCKYFKSSLALFQNLVKSQGLGIDFDSLSEDDQDYILSSACDRYIQSSALIGTPETCAQVVAKLQAIGVDEIACLIDFGVNPTAVVASLPELNTLRELYQNRPFFITAPLSTAQKQLWVLAQLSNEASTAYNESVSIKLQGKLNLPALTQAMQQIVNRHEALRTSISPEGDVQQIFPRVEIIEEGRGQGAGGRGEFSSHAQLQEPFDLTKAPLFRLHLIQLSPEEHTLTLTGHHIIVDGWSVGVILQELSTLYTAICQGEKCQLPTPMQYREYINWQIQQSQTEEMATHEQYWLQKFADTIPALDLPSNRTRTPIKTYRGSKQSLLLHSEIGRAIKKVSLEQGCTLFMTLLAVYTTLLHRLTGQSNIIVGIPTAGRSLPGSDSLVGYCAHVLPISSDYQSTTPFSEYLLAIRNVLLEAYQHQDYPFAELIQKLNLNPDASRSPLVTVTFNLDRSITLPKLDELETSWFTQPINSTDYDIHWNITQIEDELILDCHYNTDLFDATTIERWLGHFQTLLTAIIANPRQPVGELPLLTATELQQLLVDWNATQTDYPADKCIHQIFEAQVEKTPDAVAVIGDREELTYAELNNRANQVAHYLRRQGVESGVLVGICMQRSLDFIVGVLGILKAGGVYVPLDPEYPQERLAWMLEDVQPQVLLTQTDLIDRLPTFTNILSVDAAAIKEESTENLDTEVTADNLAYIMYTSGSTGKPKGVSIPHRGVVRLVKATDYLSFTSAETWLQLAPISFDAATLEIWGSLLNGSKLVIMPIPKPSLEEIGQIIQQHQITTLWLTASLFHLIVDERIEDLKSVQQLIAGGDVLSIPHVKKVLQHLPQIRLVNGYGPTENTTFTCCYPITSDTNLDSSVPIGRPIANTRVYILDPNLQPVPIGVWGELHTGGAGLAQGYWKRPDLTQEKFIQLGVENSTITYPQSLTLYKTGDLTRYRPDGTIEFRGRIDQQIKIRGFRIELGEIETKLATHPQIKQTVVTTQADTLIAYFIPEAEAPTNSELRHYLKQQLPDYMLPSAFVCLDTFPLTPNGKVDRKALPEADLAKQAHVQYIAPCTEKEQVIATIIASVLNLEKVGIADNFFEIGGNSLNAMQVISRLRQTFGVELPLRQMLESPTVMELSAHIEQIFSTIQKLQSTPVELSENREEIEV
ncbi:MupA/Atu3671 family FMN-dependent luciferase-like monooxygenase [Anabaena sp. CCY 9402-a]|uniref:MupA/Atu3671 family FMN-dependent luciferase-like monooxygenase n=1 Tax=Anabaena sp. CCY 9402-a TaxID=3103867 RepID=UPI0039C63FA6